MANVEWKTMRFKADANKCYKEIMAIGDEASPQEIVDAARDPKSELHKCFTWDDTKAAEKWRKQEARIVTANLVVRYETKDGGSEKIRVIVQNENRKYEQTRTVFERPDGHVMMLRQAKAELSAFKKKYSQLQELNEILELIDW